jgi:hypothetical protein
MTAVTTLKVRPVDPRDQRWEVRQPAYRVYFWRSWQGGCSTREFELSGGDVLEVLSWADRNAKDGETFTLHVTASTSEGLGLIRLAGDGPTRT